MTAYRDAFTLLLAYAESTLGKAGRVWLEDIDQTLILGFLEELETCRSNTMRTRNARLAAIRPFLPFASRHDVTNRATTTAALAAGADAGGNRAAAMYTLIGTALQNEINPETGLRHVLERIADLPVSRVNELLP